MSVQSSASLKRLNHLQCEMSVVYHEMSLSVGQSDSVIHILYLESTGSRNKRVILTEKGKQLAAKTAGKVIAAENRIFEEWGSEEAEKFLALNERYLKCLRAELKRLKEETM